VRVKQQQPQKAVVNKLSQDADITK
ncbi:uncharacterized protein METZ01_LOCUS159950, partial [marine metagenome]